MRGVSSYSETGTVAGGKSYRNVVGLQGLGRRNQVIDFCKRKKMVLSSPTHGLRSLREDSTPGKQQEMEFDTIWSIVM